jgi:hypothetical protein
VLPGATAATDRTTLRADAGSPTRPATGIALVDPPAMGPNRSSSSSSVSPEGLRESTIRFGVGRALNPRGKPSPTPGRLSPTALVAVTPRM